MQLTKFREQVAIEEDLLTQANAVARMAFATDGENLLIDGINATAGLETVYNVLGINKRYASHFPMHLMLPHIEYKARQSEKTVSMTSLYDTLVGFSKPNFRPLLHNTILDAVEQVVGKEANIDDVQYSLAKSNFMVTNGVYVEPKVGDVTKAGIMVRNSVLGVHQPEFSLVAKRLVCTNGMVRTETITRIAAYDRGLVPDIIDRLWSQSQNFVDGFAGTVNVRINNNPAILASFLAHHRIGGRTIGRILEAVEDAKPETLYDLINVLTYIGTHETRGRWAQLVLQGLGAKLSQEYRTCGECHNILV